MQKIGTVSFHMENDRLNLYIAYNTDDLSITRIDMFDDPQKYDTLNTFNCTASYYKEGAEYYYGDDSLIQKVLKLMNKVIVMPGERKTDVDIIDGVVVMTSTKQFTEKNGTSDNTYIFKQVLKDGDVTEEIYISPTIELRFSQISNNTSSAVKPLTFGVYEKYGDDVLSVSQSVSYSSAEYYTEEELKLRYPGKLDHLYTYDSIVCGSLEEAIIRLQELRDSNTPRIAVDIESTGLEVGMFGPDCITGVVISFTETQSTYYPFRQEGCEYNLPIWFMSEILDAYNAKGKTRKSCTFNGKMEIKSFWKERPPFLRFSEYAQKWKTSLYESKFSNDESTYQPNDFEKNFVEHNKYAQLWLTNPEKVNLDGDLMTVYSNDDGLHTSIKLDQRRGRGIHALKTISEKITGKFWLELDLIFKGEIKFNVLPKNLIRLYACPDTMNTIRVCRVLEEQFPKGEMKVLELENKLNYVKSENEFFGLPMDAKELDLLIAEDTYIKDLLEKMFREIHHTSKNIRSNAVKADIFYNRLKAKVLLRTTTGAPSASNAALKSILDSGVIPKDEVKAKKVKTPDITVFIKPDGGVCTYDKLTQDEKNTVEDEKKLKDDKKTIKVHTVIKGSKLDSNRYPSLIILDEFNKICKELGALTRLRNKSFSNRFQFYIISDGADSDRQTSDAHQFSDTMKKCVIADSSHHHLISCDYKQLELRVLSFLAGEKELTKLMFDPSVDIHRAIIQRITGTPMWMISNEQRKKQKQVNFGVVYGMTEYGLVRRLFGVRYTPEQLVQSIQMIMDFYNGLPHIKAFKAESEAMVLEDGKVETAFGFIRYFDYVKDPNTSKKMISKALKAGNNTRVQGFGATMMKLSECLYRDYIHEKGWDELVECDGLMLPKVRMMLSIHDEVLISAHDSIPIEEIIEMCKVCQELPIKDGPPFFAAPAFVGSWYDGKKDEYEIPIQFRDKIIEAYNKDGTHLLHYDTYLKDLDNFREHELTDWMDDLISEYKTEEEVVAHVRHPDLTHVLISGYIKSEDNIDDHLERIKVAVHRYMSGHNVEYVEKEDEKAEEASYIDETGNLGEYIYFNEDGEQITEYVDKDTEEELTAEVDDPNSAIDESLVAERHLEPEYAYYGLCECMIDVNSFYRMPWRNDVHNAIIKVAKENPGDYKLVYIYGKGLAPVGYNVAYCPEEFNTAIKVACLKYGGDENAS